MFESLRWIGGWDVNADATIRSAPSTDQGTFGILRAGRFSAYTGELPWRDNRAMVSCIPGGTYDVIWAYSPRFKRETYRLVAVPQRAGVLKHGANLMGDAALGFVAQLNGCIALGEKLGALAGQAALLLSQPAIRRFHAYMGRNPYRLEIIRA